MLLRLVALSARSYSLNQSSVPALLSSISGSTSLFHSQMAPKAKKAKVEAEAEPYTHTKEVSGTTRSPTGAVHSIRIPFLQRFIADYEVLKTELMADEIMGDPPAHAKSWFARVGVHACRDYLSLSVTAVAMDRHSSLPHPPLLFQMMDYNVKGGKLNRGMAVYDTLQALKKVTSDCLMGVLETG